MDNFDLRKYLAENKLIKEESMLSPKSGDKFKIEGDYYISQPNSKYNRQIGDGNNQIIHIEYVKETPNGGGFFRIEGEKRIFQIPKKDYSRLIPVNENKLVKEEFVKGTPQYYVKYTTLDGKEVKSELMSKREAIYKERDLVDSGIKKSSVYKIQKNMDLNGKEYEIEYELDKDIEYRTDEEGKPIAENKLVKENEEPTGFLFRFSKEDAMNKAMEVLDQKDISYNELGVHLVFHDKFGPATEEEVSEILRGEDILDWVIGEWKGDIYLKSEEEIKNM